MVIVLYICDLHSSLMYLNFINEELAPGLQENLLTPRKEPVREVSDSKYMKKCRVSWFWLVLKNTNKYKQHKIQLQK
jgi:hypothetical protein